MPHQHDEAVIAGFRADLEAFVPILETEVRNLEADPGNTESAREVHRILHTIRGACNMVGLDEMAQLAGSAEEYLERFVNEELPLDPDGGQLLAEVTSMIKDGIAPPEIKPKPAAAAKTVRKAAPAQGSAQGPSVEDLPPELVEGFLQEAEEHLQSIDQHLRTLSADSGRRDVLQEVRRSFHTLKGAAGMVGFRTIGGLAHRCEDLLDLLYDGHMSFTPAHHSLITATYDVMCDLVARTKPASEIQPALDQLYARYEAALADGPAEAEGEASEEPSPVVEPAPVESAPAEAEFAATPAEARDPRRFVRVPIEKLDELARLVSELLVNRSGFEQQQARYVHEVGELSLTLQRLRRVSNRLETEYALPALASAPAQLTSPGASGHGEFDALEFDRYTEFHLLTRDLAETGSDIGAAGSQLSGLIGDFDGSLNRLGRLVSEVQDKLMRLRMVPLAQIASRLHRTVRVTAEKRSRQAALVIDGSHIELDKAVLEELSGPLDHLLRNAVDHGLEDPDRRVANGKPRAGAIRLSAAYEGTQAVIRLSDDGRGIDSAVLRSAAVRNGYLAAEAAASATLEQLYGLLFEPGFSTASEITDISGRGVGLDVVRDTVTRLKGTVSIESVPGKGTTFLIRLPLTLSITKVLLVREAGETLAVPLGAVTQIARVEANQVDHVGQKPVVRLGENILPLVRLAQAIGLRKASSPEQTGRLPIVVLRSGSTEFALAVDRIAEAREVVVKNLTGVLRTAPAIAGATLMGDGSVVLILNTPDLAPGQRMLEVRTDTRRPAAARKSLDVLIVDDSLSVRRVVANLISNAGWNPLQAKDGVEALEMLQQAQRRPDIVLMDVEMPRMDGFELAATMRGNPAYRDLPIVMLTSRAGQKHRQKAMSVGVNDYLVKPYQDDDLLDVVRRCVQAGRAASPVEAVMA